MSCAIRWQDDNGVPILDEIREITILPPANGGYLEIEFVSRLTARAQEVTLDGDAEHGGMQYRAHAEVAIGSERAKRLGKSSASGEELTAARAKLAKYLFPHAEDNPREQADLPWVAMMHGLGDREYTIQHMNHPDNPRGSMYSAYRDYGRFGPFFKASLKEGEQIVCRYRIWISVGSINDRALLQRNYERFLQAPAAGEK